MSENKLEHIALILDGNKRWAKINSYSLKNAYKKGLQNINTLIENCLKKKIAYLTLFTLSSENIKRTSINNIFEVIYDEFSFFLEKLISQNAVKIKVIGSKDKLPNKILELIERSELETKDNKKMILTLAFNYGFKEEVRDIINKLIKNNRNNYDDISHESIKKSFYLGSIPDPDLLIRTGGNRRLSNFILYNLTYTEIYFIDTLWPDFKIHNLNDIIKDFKLINRSYGL